jgi:hypothetical protein
MVSKALGKIPEKIQKIFFMAFKAHKNHYPKKAISNMGWQMSQKDEFQKIKYKIRFLISAQKFKGKNQTVLNLLL